GTGTATMARTLLPFDVARKGFAERRGSARWTVRLRSRDAVRKRLGKTNRAGPRVPTARGCKALLRWIGPNSSDTSRRAAAAWIAPHGGSARQALPNLYRI